MTDELLSKQNGECLDSITPMQMSIAVGFKLLNVPLYGTLESHADGTKELLIMPSMNYSEQPFTLIELIEGLNTFLKNITGGSSNWFTADNILRSLENFLEGINADSLSISIKQVFLHVTKPKSGNTLTEYAFSLKITNSANATPKDFTFASIDSLSFGIWNTDNNRVLSNMGLMPISQWLG